MSNAAAILKMQDEQIEQTVRSQKSRLYNFILKRVPDRQEAEDILQDVFYEVIEAQRLMKPIEQLSAWMFRVARNRIIDGYRKRKPVSMSSLQTKHEEESGVPGLEDLLPDLSGGPEAELARGFILDALSEALEELPEEQRQAFVWHELDGLSFRQMAENTGETVNTLISRKRYAILFLRERLRYIYDEL